MTLRLNRPALISRFNNFLFGKNLDENEIAVDALRDLMAVESAVRDTPSSLRASLSSEARVIKDDVIAQKRDQIESVSDQNILFLNELLPRFKDEERAQIINDVTGGMTNPEASHYLDLLEATADLSKIAPVFDDDTFLNLVKGLSHGTISSGSTEEKVRSQQEVLVRFGMVMSLATRHGVARGTFNDMYKEDTKSLGLVLRDPSLESLLIRNPENLEKITRLVFSDPGMTGNRIGGIILVESKEATTYTVSGSWS
jgi:hypothetical protein